jgi:FtsH-binding integral membrane protein
VVAGIHLSDWLWILCGITGYGVLFARTIRENRKNRGVVLGVITVCMFLGFLFLVYLTERHAASWLVDFVLTVTILTGVSVLSLVGLDVVRWMHRNGKSGLNEKDDKPLSASGLK